MAIARNRGHFAPVINCQRHLIFKMADKNIRSQGKRVPYDILNNLSCLDLFYEQIKGPLGCLVSVKKRLKYTLPNSYYKSKCFARAQKACMLFTLAIFTGSSLKTFAPLKK